MQTHIFPTCCGAVIISDFGYDGEFRGTLILGSWAEEIRRYLRNHKIVYQSKGFTYIILNSSQRKAGIDKVIEECGWEQIGDGAYHPGHGRDLFTYAFYHHPSKRVPLVPSEVKKEEVKAPPKKKKVSTVGIFGITKIRTTKDGRKVRTKIGTLKRTPSW